MTVKTKKTEIKSIENQIYKLKKINGNYKSNLTIISKTLTDLAERIKLYKKQNNSTSNKTLNEILTSIYFILSIERKINFKNSFEEEFFTSILGFKETLKIKHPNLTNTEIEYCTLFYLKLNGKEISTTKGISYNSVSVIKNRIKNKLNVYSNKSIEEYLDSLI